MANIKAKVRRNTNRVVAQTLKVGNISLADLTDVNSAGQADGAVLVFNGTTSKFDITPLIGNSNTNITGGTY
tara:strand:+ start:788 stop:1003 length:216 start_codon:yes stop_codon:yes gene_type:complete